MMRDGEVQAWDGQREKLVGWVLVCVEHDGTQPYGTHGWG